jgi:hypothetical protein
MDGDRQQHSTLEKKMENDLTKGGAEKVSVLLLLVPGCYLRSCALLLLRSSFGSQQATTGDVNGGDRWHCGLIDGDWIQGLWVDALTRRRCSLTVAF